MRGAASFVIALVVVIVVLEVVKSSRYARYAWLYVAILLLGMMVYNRTGLTAFANDLKAKLSRGG